MSKREEDKKFRKEFGKRFNELRGEMSQDAFADKIDISRPTVGFYENGKRLPDAEILVNISKACGVSVDWLLGRTTDKSGDAAITELEVKLGLSADAIKSLMHYARIENDIYAKVAGESSPTEALNTLFMVFNEKNYLDIYDDEQIPDMDFFWQLYKYFHTTKEELEKSLIPMNYIKSEDGYEIITEEDLEEILYKRVEKRLKHYRKITQEKLQADKLKDSERGQRSKKRTAAFPEESSDAE